MERWVKNITKFFIDNNVGIAQRENLSSLSDKKDDTDFFKFQRMFWTRYKFQNMLDNKLKEVGIKIIEINPKYTSQICSNPKCRHWNKYFDFEYRRENKFPLFKCEMCEKNDKYKDDEKKKYRGISADYNAAKNIATPNIEKIIEKITKNDKCNCDFCKMKA